MESYESSIFNNLNLHNILYITLAIYIANNSEKEMPFSHPYLYLLSLCYISIWCYLFVVLTGVKCCHCGLDLHRSNSWCWAPFHLPPGYSVLFGGNVYLLGALGHFLIGWFHFFLLSHRHLLDVMDINPDQIWCVNVCSPILQLAFSFPNGFLGWVGAF